MPVVPLLLLPFLFQTAAPQASLTPPLSTYRNDVLRLAYAYPSTFVDATSLVKPAFEASVGQDPESSVVAQCISLPFSRMQPDKNNLGLLVMVRADAACFKKKFNAKSTGEFAEGEAKGLSASGAKTSFGAPQSFSVAGRPASAVSGTFTLPTGQAMQARVVCVLDQPDVVCWQFLAATPATLNALGTYPVTFDGSPAAAVVPASLDAAP